jgi:hypothetical protein
MTPQEFAVRAASLAMLKLRRDLDLYGSDELRAFVKEHQAEIFDVFFEIILATGPERYSHLLRDDVEPVEQFIHSQERAGKQPTRVRKAGQP